LHLQAVIGENVPHPPEQAQVTAVSRFLRYAFIGCIVACLLFGSGIAVWIYRVRGQANLVARLKRHGAAVTYARDARSAASEQRDQAPPLLSRLIPRNIQNSLGRDFFDSVVAVYAARLDDEGEQLQPLSDEDAAAICELCRGLPQLRSFGIKNPTFRTSQITAWPHFRNLRSLDIDSEAVTDQDLAVLADLVQLESLSLVSPHVTDSGLTFLTSFSKLRQLKLESPQLTDAVFQHLRPLQLENFDLAKAQVSDSGILALDPSNLASVRLANVPIGDRGIAHLISNSNLRSLGLWNTQASDACLPAIATAAGLQSLHIVAAQLTDDGLSALSGCSLRILRLDKMPITDACLEHVAKASNPERPFMLSMQDTHVSGTGCKHLASADLLRLNLSGNRITREGLAEIAKLKPYELILSRTSLSDADLLLLVSMDNTTQIDVRETRLTPAGIRDFEDARIRHCIATDRSNDLRLQSDFRYEDLPPSQVKPEEFDPDSPPLPSDGSPPAF
jgi:hypothetical protein